MAKKKAATTQMATIGNQSPVEIVFPDLQRAESPLPAGVGTVRRAAPSGLAPVALFSEPGDYLVGRYLGIANEAGTGPNKSMMYHLEREPAKKGEKPLVVGVWGSTILDSKMKMLAPANGARLFVRYMGDVPTSKGLNPAKDWDVMELEPAQA